MATNYGQDNIGEVVLTVYDISMGAAKFIAPLILGNSPGSEPIDIIPHSGIIIGGIEYFFSGGIRTEFHHDFVQQCGLGSPVKKLNLGVSKRSWREWSGWIEENSHLFTCGT